MKRKIFPVLLLSLLSLAFAAPARAQCATGEPLKPEKLTFTSLEGNATLCGFSEYTNPSTPPKKYRTQTLNGYVRVCNRLVPGCTGGITSRGTASHHYSGTYNFAAGNCAETNGQADESGGLDYQPADTICGSEPLSPGTQPGANFNAITGYPSTSFTLTTTKTSKEWVGDQVCHYDGYTSYFGSGTARAELSNEDTEADAEKRAGTTSGTSNAAFRIGRTTGFSFGFRKVDYVATFNVNCPGNYDIHLSYEERHHGMSGPPDKMYEVVERRPLESGTRTVSGSIQVKAKATNYTITAIKLHP